MSNENDFTENSNILNALNGNFQINQSPIKEPNSPILDSIINNDTGGGSGGIPADYQELKQNVAQNASNIKEIQKDINDLQQAGGGVVVYPTTIGLIKAGGGAIETDISLDYDNVIEICCMTLDGKQSCPIGRRNENAQNTLPRTELKFLGASKKIQWQWFENTEFPPKDATSFPDLSNDIIKPRIWRFSKNYIQCFDLQGKINGQYAKTGVTINGNFPNYTLCLYGDTTDNVDFTNCVIWWAKIYNKNNELVGNFIPAKNNNNDWGFLNTVTSEFLIGNLKPFQPA